MSRQAQACMRSCRDVGSILMTFLRLQVDASSADKPALDDRASWGPKDVAQDVVPRVSSTLVTGAARSRIKIHRDVGHSQSTERPSKIQAEMEYCGLVKDGTQATSDARQVHPAATS
jgi:hypothetical protein